MKKYLLLFLICYISIPGNNLNAQINGCTDPQANNYNASATVNNGSCTYNTTSLSLTDKTPLNTPLLDETSGLEFVSNKLWTFNDSGNPNAIYRVDTSSSTVFQTVTISNSTNTDWEDMTSNNDYLFIGDFGNNNGNRQNLKIYRIHKNNLPSGTTSATADVINFSYSDQTSFPSLPNNNNFDCESMIFYNDSLHLFSKNWVDRQTRHYVLPNIPGTHVAQYRETLNAGFLVTSASIQKGGVIALIGYDNTGIGPIYLYMLYDYKNNLFFNGNKRKFNVSNMATHGQVEGIEFFNAAYGYISNERFNNIVNIPPKLKTFNLAPYLPNSFVYPKPKSGFTANATTVCSNTSISFTDQSENDPTSWQWTFAGGNPATSTVQNPTVQYNSPGIYNVTLVAINATGNDTLVKSSYISVNPRPSPIISGNSSFCSGSSIVLNAGAGYTTYSWMPGGNTQTITVTTAGVYSVTVTAANGCTGTSTPKTVIENPLPTVTANNVSGCEGASIVLPGTPAGGVWSVANPYTGFSTIYTYTYTDGNGCTNTSFPASITVNPNPLAIITGTLSFCTGSSSTLDAGSGHSAYLWSTGATTQSISVSTANTFTVTVSDANGCSGSTSASTTLIPSPPATISPGGVITICNSAQTFTANSGMPGYQWRLNGSDIAGATLFSYNATVSGNYSVVVTGIFSCTATSAVTSLSLGTGTAATITGSTTFCAGASNILTANTGAGISYQWYRNTVLQNGATTNTFNANSNGTYYVVETSTCGTAQSNSIVVSQINNPNPSVSYTTPLSFCSPGNVVLTSSTFSGVSYQWQKNSADIAGATLQNYTATTNGTYRVRQTANGCFKYAPAVTVTTATSVTAAITANGPVTFCTGGSVVLSVTNAIPGYSYQWKNNGTNTANATQSSYTATSAGSYTCLVTASCGNATSNAIVVSTGGITALVSPSGSVTICTGATAALSANTGSGYNYQWKLNNVNIAGATSATYNTTTAGSYTVAITSPCGNATSVATTVNITALTATISPTNPSICAGSAQTFTANSGYNYNYQWFRNGIAQAGATNQTYANSSNGSYTVRITQGTACTVTSSISTLTVINNPTPTITPQGPTTFCNGQSVVLQANTFGGVTYQWQKNSVDIVAATNQNYSATTAGAYRVKQTANGCTKSSPAVTVTVNCREAGGLISADANSNEVIKVMPNPFSDELTIYGLEFRTGDRIQLINMLGEVVQSQIVSTSTSNYKLQTGKLASGVYFLNVITSKEKKTVKVVKQ